MIPKAGKRILFFIEKKSSTNIRKLTNQISWLMLGKVFCMIIAIILAAVYARYLSKEEYGTYKYILSIFEFLGLFTLKGMGDSSQRSVAKGLEGAFWDTFKIRIGFGVIAILCSALIGLYYLLNGNLSLGTIFLGSAIFLVPLNISSHYNSLLMGKQLFKQVSINNTLIQLASTITLIAVVILTDDIMWLIAAFLFSGITYSTIGFVHALKKNHLNDKSDSEAISYGKHISFLTFVSTTVNQAAPFLLWHFLGPVQVAIYSFALATTGQIRNIYKLATSSVAFPKIAKLDLITVKKILPKKVLFALYITVPTSFLIAILIPYLYNLLFPSYIESIIYAQAITIMLAFSPMRLYATALTAHGSPRAIHTYSFISSSLLLSSMVAFIPIFGIWGVIISSAITQTVTNVVVFYLFKKM